MEVRAETGVFIGLGGGLNSEYLPCVGDAYQDKHTTGVGSFLGVGTQRIDQTHTMNDRRLGIRNTAIAHSGYKINRDAFIPLATPPYYRLTTSKFGAAAVANGYVSSAGAPIPPMTGTQP